MPRVRNNSLEAEARKNIDKLNKEKRIQLMEGCLQEINRLKLGIEKQERKIKSLEEGKPFVGACGEEWCTCV